MQDAVLIAPRYAMRPTIWARLLTIGLMVVVLLIITSCVTTVDGVRVFGHMNEISLTDIRQAIVACSDSAAAHKAKPEQIEVVDRDEIHVYWFKQTALTGGYDIAKRVRGKWTCRESIISVSSSR